MFICVTSEPLFKILRLYPKANDKATQSLSKDFQNISDSEFRTAKNRIGLFKELIVLLKKHLELDKQTRLQILNAVLEGNMEQVKASAKRYNEHGGGGNKQNNMGPSFIPWSLAAINSALKTLFLGSEMDGEVDMLVRRATEAATQISDSEFLSQLGQDEERYAQRFPHFKVLADMARNKAFECLEVTLMRTLRKLTPAVQRIQVEECAEGVKREHARIAEEEQDKLRLKLIKRVNDSSAQIAYSCVSSPFLMVGRDPKLTLWSIDIRFPSKTRKRERSDVMVSDGVVYMHRG